VSATYDPTLATDRDWVRFLTGDTNVASPLLSNEEIDGLLLVQTATGEAARYFAAAEALSVISIRYATVGQGLVSKSVEHLELEWGTDTGNLEAINYRISCLKKRGAFLLSTRPGFSFKVAGKSTSRDVRINRP